MDELEDRERAGGGRGDSEGGEDCGEGGHGVDRGGLIGSMRHVTGVGSCRLGYKGDMWPL